MVGRTEGAIRRHPEHTVIVLLAIAAAFIAAAAIVTLGSDCSSASISDDWSYDVTSKTLTYSGPANMPDYTPGDNPVTYLGAYDALYVVFNTNIIRIGDCALKGSGIHEMTVPSNVTSIGRLSFGECHDLKTISLPSGLKKIGEYAFVSCTMLKSVSMPSTVESIGANAFFNCISLESVDLPPYDAGHDERTLVITERAFYGCTALKTIEIPFHVTEICRSAFCGCSSLYSITFDEIELFDEKGKSQGFYSKISLIDDRAFQDCTSLTRFLVPDKLEIIGADIFKGTANLVSIETRGTNGHFRSSDGVLFDLGLTILYCYPAGKDGSSYIIPSSTVAIYETAFDGAKKLSSLAIGQSEVYSSDNGVLFDAEYRSLIRYPEGKVDSRYTIPDTVTEVCTNAFTGALNLKNLVLTSSAITFRSNSLCLGSFGNDVELNVSAPDDYRIPDNACNQYTTLNYGGGSGGNTTVLIIIIACAAVLIIALAAVLVIRRRRI